VCDDVRAVVLHSLRCWRILVHRTAFLCCCTRCWSRSC